MGAVKREKYAWTRMLLSISPYYSPRHMHFVVPMSPLIWFMIFACGVLQLPLLVDLLNEAFGVGRMVQSSVSKVPPGVAACIIVGLVYG